MSTLERPIKDKQLALLAVRIEALELEVERLKAAAKPKVNAWLDTLGKQPWTELDEAAAEAGRQWREKENRRGMPKQAKLAGS